MHKEMLSITCPLCGRKYERPIKALFEGADLVCPHCNVKLKLHGHMWQEIRDDIAKLSEES
jgi:hypothetical protein